MHLETVRRIARPYTDRESRNKFVAERLGHYIGKKVLNIGGGGKKHLKKYLPDSIEYYEVDIAGNPDFFIDLEKQLPLQFSDNSFDTVICTDVLEHLDTIYEVFSELARITKHQLIISLPNPTASFWNYVFMQRQTDGKSLGKFSKFYGLPLERPEDRHKWFFSASEALDFLKYNAAKEKLEIVDLFTADSSTGSMKRRALRAAASVAFGKETEMNLFSVAVWGVFRKNKHSIG